MVYLKYEWRSRLHVFYRKHTVSYVSNRSPGHLQLFALILYKILPPGLKTGSSEKSVSYLTFNQEQRATFISLARVNLIG